YGTLTMFRELKKVKGTKVLVGPEGEPRRINGNRAQELLFNPAGPAGALKFDSKVGDHVFEFDTKGLFGVRWLAVSMPKTEKGRANEAKAKNIPVEQVDPFVSMLDSKMIPDLGLMAGFTKRIEEPLLLYDSGPELVLDVNLPPPPKGSKLPELFVGAPLP